MPELRKATVRSFSPCEACTVRHLSICDALDAHELERLNAIVTQNRLAPQQLIFSEGDPASHLFNVIEGAVKIYKLLADGRRQITGFLFPGDFLGIALHERYTYSAEAITAVRLCRFPRGKFEKLLQEFPKLENRLLQTASNELAAAQDQMVLLGRKHAAERVASFLMTLAARARQRRQQDRLLPLPMSRADIGDYLGLTIETVSRTFTRLRRSGAIALPDHHHVEIVHPEVLRELAGIEDTEPPTATRAL
ncbi:MAG TPA: cyclic nucleotide-binding domain-containing protein [Alphaproteobacteria bacterium]